MPELADGSDSHGDLGAYPFFPAKGVPHWWWGEFALLQKQWGEQGSHLSCRQVTDGVFREGTSLGDNHHEL